MAQRERGRERITHAARESENGNTKGWGGDLTRFYTTLNHRRGKVHFYFQLSTVTL